MLAVGFNDSLGCWIVKNSWGGWGDGSFGFNLEVVVLCRDGTIQHLWCDNGGWHSGVTIGSTL